MTMIDSAFEIGTFRQGMFALGETYYVDFTPADV